MSWLYAGIDSHKDTLAVAVVDEQGRQVAGQEVSNTEDGFAHLTAMFERLGVLRVGIEGSGSFGRAVAVHLALLTHDTNAVADRTDRSSNWSVVEVPTLMTSRERRAQVGQGKTDPVDALAIARITARDPALAPVRLTVGPAADLRALLDYRDDLLLERTALANRAHAELSGLSPGYQHHVRSLTTRARVRQVLELIADDDSIRADLTRRRLERILLIDAEAAQLKRHIADLVTNAGSTLTDIHGVGPLVAARFLAEVVDARRYPTTNAFAAANGTAPIPASSGRTVRHRYNPGGNRQLNRALYTTALTQIASDTDGRAYYRRKRAEGKTGREALRCLKRRISDRVYRTMLHDAKQPGQRLGEQPGEPFGEQQSGLMAVGASDAHEDDSRPDGQRVTGLPASSLLFAQAITPHPPARQTTPENHPQKALQHRGPLSDRARIIAAEVTAGGTPVAGSRIVPPGSRTRPECCCWWRAQSLASVTFPATLMR